MANPDNAYGFLPYKRWGGADIPIETMKTESNVTLAVGDAVVIGTDSGYLKLATAADVTLAGVSAGAVSGTAATRKDATFVPALPDIVFKGQCSGTPTMGNIGEACDIEGGTGAMEVNENATSTEVIKIVGFHPATSVGLNAEVLFTIVKSDFV